MVSFGPWESRITYFSFVNFHFISFSFETQRPLSRQIFRNFRESDFFWIVTTYLMLFVLIYFSTRVFLISFEPSVLFFVVHFNLTIHSHLIIDGNPVSGCGPYVRTTKIVYVPRNSFWNRRISAFKLRLGKIYSNQGESRWKSFCPHRYPFFRWTPFNPRSSFRRNSRNGLLYTRDGPGVPRPESQT